MTDRIIPFSAEEKKMTREFTELLSSKMSPDRACDILCLALRWVNCCSETEKPIDVFVGHILVKLSSIELETAALH